jgi:hypothetical protein
MAGADTVLTNRPDIYMQSSLHAIIDPHLANRVECIYTLANKYIYISNTDKKKDSE